MHVRRVLQCVAMQEAWALAIRYPPQQVEQEGRVGLDAPDLGGQKRGLYWELGCWTENTTTLQGHFIFCCISKDGLAH